MNDNLSLSKEPVGPEQEPTTNPTLAPTPPADVVLEKHPVRMGTVVWGALIVALGLLLLTIRQTNIEIDPAQTAMWLLLGAGVMMVAGGAVHIFRKK